jgi:uncharacterized protein YjdB
VGSLDRRGFAARRWMRAASLVGAVIVAATCSDQSPVSPRKLAAGHSSFAIQPAFQHSPAGGPQIDVVTVRAVLVSANGDSVFATGRFDGDSAILVFDVSFSGTSADYNLDVTAFDANGVVAYHSNLPVTLRAGENPAITPHLDYAAPDAALQVLHVTPSTATLNSGAAMTLRVSGSTSGGVPLTTIHVGWTSKDPTIATVDASGAVVAGPSQGSTYVVARTATNIADSALVQVHAPVDHVVLSPSALTVVRGVSTGVAAELRDAGNHLIDDRSAAFSTSDASIATVSSVGVVRGTAIGTAAITASAEGKSASIPVTVVSPVAQVNVTPASLSFASLGETHGVTATPVARPGGSVTGLATTFTSSAPSVATVGSDGTVTAVGNGTATITANIDGVTATAAVTVQQLVSSLTVSPPIAGVTALGDRKTFTAAALDALGSRIAAPSVTWSSSDVTIATVRTDGTAIGVNTGSVTITATSNGKSGQSQFIVSQAARTLAVSADPDSILQTQSTTLSASTADANGNPIAPASPTWTTSTPSLISISGNHATGIGVGTAHLIATLGGLSSAVDVIVGANPTAGGGASGQVNDASTALGISGATITPSSGSGTTSLIDGTFTLPAVPNGSTLTVTATGYVTTQFFNVQTSGGISQVGSIPLAPVSTQNGFVNGRVIDATTAFGLGNATVSIRSGINAVTGQTVATATSDASGNYSVQLPAGTYTLSATASGFAIGSSTIVSIGGITTSNQNVSLVPGTGLRITLTWGANPRDLDSHLFGPAASGGRFHTWFAGRNGPDGERLDNDFTGGFGPENTTVPTPLPGVYRFYVQHFSGSSSMAAGNATVTVTLNGIQLGTFHPPARPNEQNGDIWEVFSLSGSTITAINTFVSGSSGTVPEAIRRGAARAPAVPSDVAGDLQAIRDAMSRTKRP